MEKTKNARDDEAPDVPRRVADTMEQAAGMLAGEPDPAQRLTREQIARAKAAGCIAFRGGRVYVDELLTWWDEFGAELATGNSELDALNTEIAREKLRAVRFKNEVDEGKYVLREDEAARIEALGIELQAVLRKRLEEEFPDRQANRTREEIQAINRDLVDELCRQFQEGTRRWSQQRK